MSDLHFDGHQVSIEVPSSQANECCAEGRAAYASYEDAYMLREAQGMFSEVSRRQFRRLERRAAIASECDFASTGKCALKAAGLFEAYPE
jgi:hypothetical protein